MSIDLTNDKSICIILNKVKQKMAYVSLYRLLHTLKHRDWYPFQLRARLPVFHLKDLRLAQLHHSVQCEPHSSFPAHLQGRPSHDRQM